VPRGLVYEVQGKPFDAGVAAEAIARGWLRPVDGGLLGKASAQAWELRAASADNE
jgi:hypothetical protein